MVETHTLQKLRSRKVKDIKGILSGQFGTKNVDMKGLLKAGLIDLVLRKQSERDRGVDTAQSKRKTISSPSSSAKVPTEKTSLDKLFDKYSCDPSSSCMGMEGLSALADDLNMDETDLRVMVLAWKMGAGSSPGSTPGTITRKEFVEGLSSNGMKNLGDIKKHIPSLDAGFLLPTQFMSFYTFFFKFNLEGTHKTLENEFARDCLSCVLSGRRNEHLEQFTKFLASSDGMSRFERITLDQWTSFLSFSLINPRSCFGYDEIEANCAWPVLIDEYVDWVISETGKEN